MPSACVRVLLHKGLGLDLFAVFNPFVSAFGRFFGVCAEIHGLPLKVCASEEQFGLLGSGFGEKQTVVGGGVLLSLVRSLQGCLCCECLFHSAESLAQSHLV